MSDTRYLPALGMRGKWQLAEPYRDLVVATGIYTCDSIQRLAAAVANNEDPLNNLYLAIGDTEASYRAHLAADDYLITISSPGGDKVTFPRPAMLGLPSSDGVVYQNTVLTMTLGILPVDYDFAAFEDKLKALVLSNLGVRASPYFHTVMAPILLTHQQADTLNAGRQAAITDPTSTQNKLDVALQINESLTTRLALLESYIATHFSEISPP
jgi:hypothetical protein